MFKIHFLIPCCVRSSTYCYIISFARICLETIFINSMKVCFKPCFFWLYVENILPLLLLPFYLFFYSIWVSFHIYVVYTFHYYIESLKVWRKPKYNLWGKKCLAFGICLYIHLKWFVFQDITYLSYASFIQFFSEKLCLRLFLK